MVSLLHKATITKAETIQSVSRARFEFRSSFTSSLYYSLPRLCTKFDKRSFHVPVLPHVAHFQTTSAPRLILSGSEYS